MILKFQYPEFQAAEPNTELEKGQYFHWEIVFLRPNPKIHPGSNDIKAW